MFARIKYRVWLPLFDNLQLNHSFIRRNRLPLCTSDCQVSAACMLKVTNGVREFSTNRFMFAKIQKHAKKELSEKKLVSIMSQVSGLFIISGL